MRGTVSPNKTMQGESRLLHRTSCPSHRAADGRVEIIQIRVKGPGFPFRAMIWHTCGDEWCKASTAPAFGYTGILHCAYYTVTNVKNKYMCIKTRCNEWPRKAFLNGCICCMFLPGKRQLDGGRSFTPVSLSSGHHPYSFCLFPSFALLHTQALHLNSNVKVLHKDSVFTRFSKIWTYLYPHNVTRRRIGQRRRKQSDRKKEEEARSPLCLHCCVG